MKRFITVLLGLLSVTGISLATEASGGEQLQQFVNQVTTLKAAFTQEVINESGAVSKKSSGLFSLSKPGKFRWIVTQPYPQEIIADGKTIWIYDPDLEQVTLKSFSDSLSASPLALLTQQQALETNYKLEDIQYESDGLDWVSLKPRSEETDFQQVYIGMQNNRIEAMDLFDQFGQRTRIRFTDIEINTGVDDQSFNFIPPEGVDVIGGTS